MNLVLDILRMPRTSELGRNAAEMARMIAEDDADGKRYVDKGYEECRNNLTEMRAANGIGAQQGGGPRRVMTTKCIPTTTGVTCN